MLRSFMILTCFSSLTLVSPILASDDSENSLITEGEAPKKKKKKHHLFKKHHSESPKNDSKKEGSKIANDTIIHDNQIILHDNQSTDTTTGITTSTTPEKEKKKKKKGSHIKNFVNHGLDGLAGVAANHVLTDAAKKRVETGKSKEILDKAISIEQTGSQVAQIGCVAGAVGGFVTGNALATTGFSVGAGVAGAVGVSTVFQKKLGDIWLGKVHKAINKQSDYKLTKLFRTAFEDQDAYGMAHLLHQTSEKHEISKVIGILKNALDISQENEIAETLLSKLGQNNEKKYNALLASIPEALLPVELIPVNGGMPLPTLPPVSINPVPENPVVVSSNIILPDPVSENPAPISDILVSPVPVPVSLENIVPLEPWLQPVVSEPSVLEQLQAITLTTDTPVGHENNNNNAV